MEPPKNRLITRKKIREFCESHPELSEAKAALDRWYRTAEAARWGSFADVRRTFGSADQVGKFTVFNVGGNKYRVVAVIHYNTAKIYIRHILTHAEYDKGRWKA